MKITLGNPYSFKRIGKRDNQEDARYPDEDQPKECAPFFLVCDGVGGCQKGEVASNTVCLAMAQALEKTNWDEDFTNSKFSTALFQAYEAMERTAHAGNRDMATTLSFVCFHAEGCLAAHIGDSRIYHVRPGTGILYRSEDHSLVNALVHSGNITPEEAIGHPRSNVITRCIGVVDKKEERADATVIQIDDLQAGDYFFLCTDGVLESVNDEELVSVLSSDMPDEEKLNCLADLCQESQDNHTAYLIPVASVEHEKEPETAEIVDVPFSENDKGTEAFSRKQKQACDVAATPVGKAKDLILNMIQKLFK